MKKKHLGEAEKCSKGDKHMTNIWESSMLGNTQVGVSGKKQKQGNVWAGVLTGERLGLRDGQNGLKNTSSIMFFFYEGIIMEQIKYVIFRK